MVLALQLAAIAFLAEEAVAQRREEGGPPRFTLVHDGVQRGYRLHVPPRVASADRRVPLVIDLHGGGGNGLIAATMTGFTAKADREGFIVVYPEGTGGTGDILLTWNAGHCCAQAMRRRVDDVGFVAALIDRLVREHPVDPARIYATGMSNGAMMAHRLGIELSDRIAAIAPVVGALFGDERLPRVPVPALIINGALDRSVPVDGGTLGGRGPRGTADAPLKPAAYQGEFWARANRCAGQPVEEQAGPNLRRWRHTCPTGQEVVRLLVLDGGHAWPGGRAGSRRGDRPSSSVDATDLIWEFFRTKSRAGR